MPGPCTRVHTSPIWSAGQPWEAQCRQLQVDDASSPWGCISQMTKGIEHSCHPCYFWGAPHHLTGLPLLLESWSFVGLQNP